MVLFLPNAKCFRNKIEIQVNSTPLVIEQINYTMEIVNVSIVYNLDKWPNQSTQTFYIKNLFVWFD